MVEPVIETPAPVTPAPVTPAPEAEPTAEPAVEAAVEAVAAPESRAADADLVEPDPVEDAAEEPTVVIVPAKPKVTRSAKAVKVSTVPESRRAKARARREANEKSKAEKAAIRAQAKAENTRPGPAELLVSKMPAIKPAYAAMLTGLISGLICVALGSGTDATCKAIRSDDSCGGGMQLLVIVAILAIEVLIGANLLKAWKVADPFSTSFLGVGLVAMVSMLFYIDAITSAKMLYVIPPITALSFLISWWVTVRFVEEPDDDEPDAA